MATNFEFYKNEILKWFTGDGAICLLYRELTGNELECAGDCGACGKILADFLEQEHIEVPKLTKRERAFCEAVQTGWIARDCNMHLFYFSGKPKLEQGTWMTRVGQHCRIKGLEDAFMFIKDTDAECWSVEDLLKLEFGEGQDARDMEGH